jgi:hypothetical protein
MVHSLTDDVGLAAALAGRPQDLALACRAALKALEESGDLRDADRSLRELAIAFAAVAGIAGRPSHPRLDVVLTTRTNRATATCDAPNCAGHRVRA